MDTRSIENVPSDEELFPPNMLELQAILDRLVRSDKDEDECLSICMMMFNSDESDEDSLNNENAPFEEVFDMPLIDETLKFARTANTVQEISDFIWDRLPEMVVDEDE